MPGPALAPSWSPIGRTASTTGPSVGRPAPAAFAVVAVALAVAGLGALVLLLGPVSGTDAAAQDARAAFARAHPGAAVDFRWFGGVFPAAYSVAAPYVEALLGWRLAGYLAALVGASLLALLLVRWRVRRPVLGAAWGAAALLVNMVSGRSAFALGLTVALLALVCVPPWGVQWWRWVPAVVVAALTSLTSPVAAAFLALVAIVWALRRRAVVSLAVAVAVPLAVVGWLFPEPGSMPFSWAVARPLLLGCVAVVVLCRDRLLRLGTLLYAVAIVVLLAVPGPVGSNVERLGLLFTGLALIADAALPIELLLVALVVAGQWTARDPLRDLQQSGSIGVERVASQRLVGILARLGPLTGRVEVVPFLDHGEASVVAQHALLARGWERQVDEVRAAPLYRSGLTPAAYVGWLRAHSVEYVALGRHRHDWSAGPELALLSARTGVPGLRLVYADKEWSVWVVASSPALVRGAGHAVRLGASSIVVAADGTGPVHVDVRWSRWLTVSGPACIRPDGAGVALVPSRAGEFSLSSAYTGSRHHCPSGGA